MEITIKDIIFNISLLKEEDVVYARRIDGKFLGSSEVIILELTDEEKEMSISEIVEFKCPGFDYFLESFMIKEMVNEFDNLDSTVNLDKRIEVIIHYAEFDA